ncbi:unnamed protein product, partial [Ostreobium quekettii]
QQKDVATMMRLPPCRRWVIAVAVAVCLLHQWMPHSECFADESEDINPCERFPYLVSVLRNVDGTQVHGCSGVLVNERWAITAAHCLDAAGSNPSILFGACDGDSGKVVATNYAAVHPRWTGLHWEGNDIALLRLEHGAPQLPGTLLNRNGNELSGDVYYASTTTACESTESDEDEGLSVVRRASAAGATDRETCRGTGEERWGDLIQFSMTCVTGGEICDGDSGGALTKLRIGEEPSTDLITGLASFPYDEEGCASASQPRAFTKLLEYLDWMAQATEEVLESSEKEAVAQLPSAASRGDTDAVKASLDAGATIVARPLAPAFFSATRAGHIQVLQLLLDAGADPSEGIQGGRGLSWPLSSAVSAGDVQMVKFLLGVGARAGGFDRLIYRGGPGESLVSDACWRQGDNYDEVVRLLLEAGACGSCGDAVGPECPGRD